MSLPGGSPYTPTLSLHSVGVQLQLYNSLHHEGLDTCITRDWIPALLAGRDNAKGQQMQFILLCDLGTLHTEGIRCLDW